MKLSRLPSEVISEVATLCSKTKKPQEVLAPVALDVAKYIECFLVFTVELRLLREVQF